jgi:predicted phosphodiesterase
MKYLIYSDVQGNYSNLDSFIQNTRNFSGEKACLGDIVQNGESFNDNRCIDLVRNSADIVIKGNHEEKILKKPESAEKIYSNNLEFIQNLPSKMFIDKKYLFFHDSISGNSKRITSEKEVTNEFQFLKENYPDCKIGFYGHTHKASLFEISDKNIVKEMKNIFGKDIVLDEKKKYLVNPGGMGLYYNMPLSYLIFDADKKTLTFKKI